MRIDPRGGSGSTVYREGPSGRDTTRDGADAPVESWRASGRDAAREQGVPPISGVPEGDWSTREAPSIRFPRMSESPERPRELPGSGPSASVEARRSSSPDLQVRRGEGQTEWRSRTVTREDLLDRYRPSERDRAVAGDAQQRGTTRDRGALSEQRRGPTQRSAPSADRTTADRTPADRTRADRTRDEQSARERGDDASHERGAPGAIRGARGERSAGAPTEREAERGDRERTGRDGAIAPREDRVIEEPRERLRQRREREFTGAGDRENRERSGTRDEARERPSAREVRLEHGRTPFGPPVAVERERSARAPTRDAFRRLPPAEKRREVIDLPARDLDKARTVRNVSQTISDASNLSVRLAASTAIGFTTGSSHSAFWFGYHHGGPGWFDHCSNFWWGSHWNWWWWHGSPSWCWGGGWNWGFGWCWGSYWNWCGSWWWWHSPRYVVYYAPPPYYYSTIVYETVEYRDEPYVEYDEEAYVDEGYADTGEDVQEPRDTVLEGEGSIPIERQNELNRAADYYLTLGDRAFREGRYGDAVHYYAKAVEFSPDDGILYLILSDALFATGDYHYAAYALRKALDLDPTLAESVVDKHSFYEDPVEFDRQLAVLERYLEDHFEDDDARLVLAANYLFGGRPAAAVDLLQSSFSKSVAQSQAGTLILDAARKIQHGRPLVPEGEPAETTDD